MCSIYQPSNDRALQACCWKPDPDGVLRVIPSSWRIPPAAVQLQLFIKLVQGNDCSWEDRDIDLGGAESKVRWLRLPVKSRIFQMWLVAKCLSECVTKHTEGGVFQLNMDGSFYCVSKGPNQLTASLETTWAETIFFIRTENLLSVRNVELKL